MESVNLFTIPLGKKFLPTLASWLLEKNLTPLQMAETTVILPTERACLALEETLIQQAQGGTFVRPNILAITRWGQPQDKESPVLNLSQRHFLLARFVREKTGNSWTECFALASSLMGLLDEFYTEEVPFQALCDLVPDELSQYWQKSLDVLRLLFQEWPCFLKEQGLEEPLPWRAKAFESQILSWQENPPRGLIIAAGLVGSVPGVARFLKAISGLPQGAILFSGLDLEMEEKEWEQLPPYHPQYGLKQTLDRMACKRTQVLPLSSEALAPRTRFLQSLFAREGLYSEDLKTSLQEKALDSLSFIEADSLQEEARVVALLIREALNVPQNRIALITPHRGLSDRVTAELKRWSIVPNDSYGEILFESPRGTFLALSLDVALNPQENALLLSLLKHPFTTLGLSIAECRQKARTLEIQALRPLSPFEKFDLSRLQSTPLFSFYQRFRQALSPLFLKETDSLKSWVHQHRRVLEALTEPEDKEETPLLWHRKEGEELNALLEEFEKFSGEGDLLTLPEYRAFLCSHLKKRNVTRPYGTHPRVHMLGPLESRTLDFDVTILGALNDRHWAPPSRPDPWLSHDMKQRLGVPDERYHSGRNAADWVHLLHGKQVVLTRTHREEGVMMLPSRWLMRLKAILKSQRCVSEVEPSSPWKTWAQRLDLSEEVFPCSRPLPCPSISRRPRTLSVTDVQLWKDDPYALYAKKILKLSPLPPLVKEITPATFGILVHEVLERYKSSSSEGKGLDFLIKEGQQAFGEILDRPLVKCLWWPRFMRLCRWFLEEEEKRRPFLLASWTEVKGALKLQTPHGLFTLTAQADRIDLLKRDEEANPEQQPQASFQQALEIIDYKTGTLPSRKTVLQGDKVQLPLEAALTCYGFWQGVPEASLHALSFWQMTGGIPPGEIVRFGEGEEMAQKALKELEERIVHFEQETTPYKASLPGNDVYSLLSRRQEWAR